MFYWVLTAHLLGAAVWTGGHLVLALSVLPKALRERSPQVLRDFEAGFERVGIPALIVQVASGLWLALNARFRVIPNLSVETLALMGWHIRAVTLLSVLFVMAGAFISTGGW